MKQNACVVRLLLAQGAPFPVGFKYFPLTLCGPAFFGNYPSSFRLLDVQKKWES